MNRKEVHMHNKLNSAFAVAGLALALVGTTACQNGFMSLDFNGNDDDQPGMNTPGGGGGLPGTGGGLTDTTDGPNGCQPNDRFFMREVWAPAVQTTCYGCHNDQGAARDSGLVLYNSGWGNYIERNINVLNEFAQTTREGESVLLLKPLGRVSHGGGAVMSEGDDVYNRLKAFVDRSGATETCPEANDEDFYQDVLFLDAEQTLRKATLSLAGRIPTQAEREGEIDAVLDQLMTEEAFYQRLTESYNDLLLTDMFLQGTSAVDLLDEDLFPNARFYDDIADDDMRGDVRNWTNMGIARETIELIKHVIREDRPYSEIITADYTMVNPFSAQAYGVDATFNDPNDPNEFVEAQIPGQPHAGIVTTTTFMNRYPTTDTNRNRHRAAIFYLYFLGTDVLKLADRPIDPTQAEQSQNPTLFDADCTVCHEVTDPVAGAFQNWDDQGRYAPRDSGWYTDMLPAGIEGENIPTDMWAESIPWLSAKAAVDARFVESAVQHAFRLLTGQAPLSLPTDATRGDYEASFRAYEVQYEFFKQLGVKFVDSDYSYRTLVKEIVKSPFYRAFNANNVTPKRQAELANLGTSRLLSPEMLNRKIVATTGIQWENNGRNVLLNTNEFHLLYGGIDSVSITSRMAEPNALAASIARRMSNEVSCRATPTDFTRNQGERLLFPHVEVTDTPESSATAIRENIRHLYWHLLGENYEVSDPEVERAYTLFNDVYQDGNNNDYGNQLPGSCRVDGLSDDPDYTVRSWMAIVSLMLSDYGYLYE